MRVADPKACQCGEVLKGVLKPWECKVFGTACTPETPIGTCMVSPEGACAAYYNYGRLTRQPGQGGELTRHDRGHGSTGAARAERRRPLQRARAAASEREQASRLERRAHRSRCRHRPRGAWCSSASTGPGARRPRVREDRITMSHGAGGKATPDADRGGLPGRVPQPAARAAGGRRPAARGRRQAGADHRLLRGLAAVLPRRRHRRPGRQRHGQRPGDGRRDAAVPVGRASSSRKDSRSPT